MFTGPEATGGTPPAAPAAPAAPADPAPTPPAPPAPVPTPPATPAAPAAPVTGPETFSREYVHDLREEAKANRLEAAANRAAAEKATADLAAAQKIIADAEAATIESARTTAVTSAAENLADPAVLLDSDKFKAHIAEVKLDDPAALKASIEAFVEANPSYVATPKLPSTSGDLPGGGSGSTGATSLQGAVEAAMNK